MSSIDANGRTWRCSTSFFTSEGPAWGKAASTSGGAVLGSMTSLGATKHTAPARDPTPRSAA
jgi:hypothetical protein